MRHFRPLLMLIAAGFVFFGTADFAVAQNNQNQSGVTAKQRGEDTKGQNIDPITGQQVKKTSVVEYVNEAYNFAAIVGGLVAVLMIIWAGYRYMTSYGDPEKIADAKDIVEKSLLGLGILIFAALILNSINTRTAENPCSPSEPGCGDIDFAKPGGGINQINPKSDNGQTNSQGNKKGSNSGGGDGFSGSSKKKSGGSNSDSGGGGSGDSW